jgi:hypothetical protein
MTEASVSAEAYKRDLVRGWCRAITAAPFVDTVNVNARPPLTAPVWFTVQWQAHAVAPITYSGVTEETGELGVIVAGEPNLGDQAVAEASGAIVAELLARTDPQGHLTLERAGATTEHSDRRWYRLFTPLRYRLISDGCVITTANVIDTTAGQAADREGDYKVIVRTFVQGNSRFTVRIHPDGYATVSGQGFSGALDSPEAGKALGLGAVESILREIKQEKAHAPRRALHARRRAESRKSLLARWGRARDAQPGLKFSDWVKDQSESKGWIYKLIEKSERR